MKILCEISIYVLTILFFVVYFLLPLSTNSFAISEDIISISLEWDPNDELDLAGYKVYYGSTDLLGYKNNSNSSKAKYLEFICCDVGNVIFYTVVDLNKNKQYCFVVTAYDIYGNESEYSNEVIYNPSISNGSCFVDSLL